MALEIERRFLVKGDAWKTIAKHPQHLLQGYLVTSIEGWTVRVRIREGEKAWLTLKSQAKGIARYEFEYLIPLNDADSLWQQAPYKLQKTRYELNLTAKNGLLIALKGKMPPW